MVVFCKCQSGLWIHSLNQRISIQLVTTSACDEIIVHRAVEIPWIALFIDGTAKDLLKAKAPTLARNATVRLLSESTSENLVITDVEHLPVSRTETSQKAKLTSTISDGALGINNAHHALVCWE